MVMYRRAWARMGAGAAFALGCSFAGLALAAQTAPGTALLCRNGPVDVLSGGPAVTRCGAATAATAANPRQLGHDHASTAPQMRVSAQTQRTRDEARKAILDHELAQEQARLAALLKAGHADAAEVARTRANVDAIQRELAR